MRTKDFRSTKAITLIALVVSIVVLLILAGVSIVTLTGENRSYKTSNRSKTIITNSNCKRNSTIGI